MTVPSDSWVLRWRPDEGRPHVEIGEAQGLDPVRVFETESGNVILFEGYLFDIGKASAAEHIASEFEARGEDFIERLRGAFVVAIWDRKNDRLILGRDALGLHPAFYCWDGRRLLLSSSQQTLLALPEVSHQFHVVRIAEFLLGNSISQHLHETFYKHISRVPPAHMLVIRRGSTRLFRYWNPLPIGFSWATDEEVEQFEPIFSQAVERCLSVGAQAVALSGGFDSVGIAAIAARLRKADSPPLSALSVHFPDTECDEETTQLQVARTLGMPQFFHQAKFSASDEDFVALALAQSAGNSAPVLGLWQGLYSTLFVSAKEAGLHRVLFGTGGDEMLVVDTRYAHDLLVQADARGLYRFLRAWQRTSPYSPVLVARYLLWYSAMRPALIGAARRIAGRPGARVYQSLRARFHPPSVPIQDDLMRELRYRARMSIHTELGPGEGMYVEAMRELPQTPSLSTELEQGREWAGRFGARILYPFFDRDFVELALRVHPSHLYRGGRMKGPLRELVNKMLPSVTMPVRKVDFTEVGRDVLRRFGRSNWSRFGGATRLAELGIVYPSASDHLMENFFSGRSERWVPVWQLLSTEAWLDARLA